MKDIGSNTKLILFPSTSFYKQGGGASSAFTISHRLWLLAIVSFFTLASLLTIFVASCGHGIIPSFTSSSSSFSSAYVASTSVTPLPSALFESLLHYATFSNYISCMSDDNLRSMGVAICCHAPYNLLIFGLGHETLLWRSLNHDGWTVFLDESKYYIQIFEQRHPGSAIEAYDLSYTTRVSDLRELISMAREQQKTDYQPMQNLFFSDC